MLSIVIPVYRNEANIAALLQEMERIASASPVGIELVLVVDGSPDRSYEILRRSLPGRGFSSVLVSLSRNFGAFNAVRCGLEVARGHYFVALAADLQEPPDLALTFLGVLRGGNAEVVFGTPSTRDDPWVDTLASRVFWWGYSRLVLPDAPPAGVYSFGCTRIVRDRLIELREPTTNLAALLFWLGFRRAFVSYERAPRKGGRSAWTLGRKLRYGLDSLFSFTDLPVRLLLVLGVVGTVTAVVAATLLLAASLAGRIEVPGYAPTMLAVTFFGSITSLGLGILGQYAWLILQTTRARPSYLIEHVERFSPAGVMTAAAHDA
jgi:glycosyltransferase involved in cell wall biosynthesis